MRLQWLHVVLSSKDSAYDMLTWDIVNLASIVNVLRHLRKCSKTGLLKSLLQKMQR